MIANYRLLPRWLVAPATALLPPVELIAAALLLTGLVMPWAGLACIALLALFATAMAINLHRGRAAIDCGCGQSSLKQNLSWSLVTRNVLLMAMLLPSLSQTGALPVIALLSGVAAGVAFLWRYVTANLLAPLPRGNQPA